MLLIDLDSWLIDRVFQPVVDWLVNWRITITHLASLCFVIAPGFEIVVLYDAVTMVPSPMKSLPSLSQQFAGAVGLVPAALVVMSGMAIMLIYPLWHCYRVLREDSTSRNIWLMPPVRLEFMSLRLMWLMLSIWSTGFACFVGGWWVVGYGWMVVIGHYFWACRRRPPVQRRAEAPAGAKETI